MEPQQPTGPSCATLVGECTAKSAKLKIDIEEWVTKTDQLQITIQRLQQALAISENQARKARAEKEALEIESAKQIGTLQGIIHGLQAYEALLEAQVEKGESDLKAVEEQLENLIFTIKSATILVALIAAVLANIYFILSPLQSLAKTPELKPSTKMPEPQPEREPQPELNPEPTIKRPEVEPTIRMPEPEPEPQTEMPEPTTELEPEPEQEPELETEPETERLFMAGEESFSSFDEFFKTFATPPTFAADESTGPEEESFFERQESFDEEPEESFFFEDYTPESFFSKHFSGTPQDLRPAGINDQVWEAWMRDMLELRGQLEAEDHEANAAESRFWQTVDAMMTSMKSTFGDLLALFVSFSGKVESGGPAKTTLMKVNTGFRQLLKTVHPDKLSGCDSRGAVNEAAKKPIKAGEDRLACARVSGGGGAVLTAK
ncbi:uncharacterized protein ACA1_296900 [Acanthamoeba castellanii str. Neff]|uniref:Uncharacterized protein n=1 Tax=Acanthamoeba castellanii (strain ATCC 30010 / Neff) TaxID=1257118 RepID=L8HIZ1_ACACF|nr:uncharacterized protein ACA1_296900 [Acanthamoeba castellanii str. Neff]ELR25569.1 hypothetical protein ACA1_296900 [Acanthamoeba castellanii str. Neff]